MQLFKRVLLSLFPDEIVAQTINPASMFVSFISTKEFFSVINRKIVENYKLNLFDITLDPFEFKIWFGENIQIKPKDIDIYYWYCATANLNGYRFFSSANMANSLSLVVSIYVKDIFAKYEQEYYLNFLYTVFLLSFVFVSRIKVFPYWNKEKNYNWFVDVFFSFYEFVFSQTWKKIDHELLNVIKKELLNQIEVFFLMFAFYKKLNWLFLNKDVADKDFYSRLFYDELKWDWKNVFEEFINNSHKYNSRVVFLDLETKILQSVLPVDILLRYLFVDFDMFLMTEVVVAKLFDKNVLDKFMKWFRKNDLELEKFIIYITDYRHFKRKFFAGVQKYMITIFKNPDKHDLKDDMDDIMSSIGEDVENIESFKIPERIKKESKLMEKILNFYITLVWWFRVSRWDSLFTRMFKKPLLDKILWQTKLYEKNYTLLYYGTMIYNYGKNVFYYKYASENVRAGRQKFYLPYKNELKNVYSNVSILKSFDESSLAVILQDFNIKDIRIYLKNKKILDLFKELFGEKISKLVKKQKSDFINFVYDGLSKNLVEIKDFVKTIKSNLRENDVYHLKENVYSLDLWLNNDFCDKISKLKNNLNKNYSDLTILWVLASVRETFFGFLLYLIFLRSQNDLVKTNLNLDNLFKIYIVDILCLDEDYKKELIIIIEELYSKFYEIMSNWVSIDDNKEFLRIWYENWTSFNQNKIKEDVNKKIIWEDIIWFRWYLKNITYYNKRFLIPK